MWRVGPATNRVLVVNLGGLSQTLFSPVRLNVVLVARAQNSRSGP